MALTASLCFSACNTETNEPVEAIDDSTIELVSEMTLTESVEETIDASANEAIAASEDDDPTKSTSSTTESSCAIITISPDDGSYPRSITIDFGEQCTGFSGQTRSGAMTVTISDTLRNPGAEYSVSFDNFSVDDIMVSGTKSVKNTGTEEAPAFTEDYDLTLITPSDIEIQKVKTSTREWVEGVESYTLIDDVFETTGSAEVTSSSGRYYSYDITSPLKTTRLCENILEGELVIDWSGSDESITVDYGTGFCDWKVYISQGARMIHRAVYLNE
jgi:hypothetical protein